MQEILKTLNKKIRNLKTDKRNHERTISRLENSIKDFEASEKILYRQIEELKRHLELYIDGQAS